MVVFTYTEVDLGTLRADRSFKRTELGKRMAALEAAAKTAGEKKLATLGPAATIGYLGEEDGEAHGIWGKAKCDRLIEEIQDRRDRFASKIAGAAWLDIWDSVGDAVPFPARDHQHQSVRIGSARMILSEAMTRIGDGIPVRRWTSPLAVGVEDFLDLMPAETKWYQPPEAKPCTDAHRRKCSCGRVLFDNDECEIDEIGADLYYYPQSADCDSLAKIRAAGAKPIGGQW